jgi:hypothetical protein
MCGPTEKVLKYCNAVAAMALEFWKFEVPVMYFPHNHSVNMPFTVIQSLVNCEKAVSVCVNKKIKVYSRVCSWCGKEGIRMEDNTPQFEPSH